MRDLVALPKAELHVHLEGSTRLSTLRELSDKNGRPLPEGMRGDQYAFRDFDDFITQYAVACACLVDPEDFRRIAYEFCEDEAAQGVRYAEVTFSPSQHALRLNGDWDMPMESVMAGFEQGTRHFGIEIRIIPDIVRDWGLELARGTLEVALRFADRGVVALGLAGDERVEPGLFEDIVAEAVAAGLHSVPHAGEAAGPESIRGALNVLKAERIGHGIRCLEDPSLVQELRERRIPLEVCPTSNVATGVVTRIEEHPLPRLLDAGLIVTLNSDDPAMFSSPVVGEYRLAREVFGLDDAALAELARNAARASFAPKQLKAELEAEVDDWLAAG